MYDAVSRTAEPAAAGAGGEEPQGMNRISDEDLRWLLELLEAEGLAEIEVREGESVVEVKTAEALRGVGRLGPGDAEHGQYGTELDEHHIPVLSPVAGVFYRSASPDTEPFVALGDEVVHGDTVGVVEAMKLFNEVPAPAGGVIISILARNGQQVAADEVLMIIET